MYSCRNALVATVLCAMVGGAAAQPVRGKYPANYVGVGRAATPQEVAVWDIDVRPDFKGLPAGSGSVARGQEVWEGKCAQCHGVFGESNEIFSPLVGGTTAQDIKTGHVASLLRRDYPGRTNLMKLATVSTLWDYINRAMPWSNPKTLTTEEVYAVTAFLLNLGGVVPDDFTLSNTNISAVQQRLPNRNGMTAQHALWPGQEFNGFPSRGLLKPDTHNIACMRHCVAEASVASYLPAHARNAQGNLAEQNRQVGAQYGADTSRPEGQVPQQKSLGVQAAAIEGVRSGNNAAQALAQKHTCTACHALAMKLIGPSFAEIGKRYAGNEGYLVGKIKSGGSGAWGTVPMPPQTLSDADAKVIATWLAAGAAK